MTIKAKTTFSILLSAALSIVGAKSFAQTPASAVLTCDSEVDSTVTNKKKMVKTETTALWREIELHVSKYPEALKKRGVVVGDFHFNNVDVYFDSFSNRARLTLNDLDDAGENYIVGDLLKYLIYLQRVDHDLDLAKVIDAYVLGLERTAMAAPSDLQDLLSSKSGRFAKKQLKFIEKRKEEALAFDPKTLTDDQKKTMADLQSLPVIQNNFTNLEGWIQINDSGSSSGMERYLFLAKSIRNQSEGVLEFKDLKCSATGPQDRQDLLANRKIVLNYIQNLTPVLGPNQFLNRQTVLPYENRVFQLREKHPNFMKDLNIEKMSGSDLQEYSEFFANYLGQFHSPNSSAPYMEALDTYREALVHDVKAIFKDFKRNLK